MTTLPREPDLLGIYLNDHLAGAEIGVNLAQRLAAAQREGTDAEALGRLVNEIVEDRDALVEIMASLDISLRRYKVWGAWIAERTGRLKLNGRLLSRSPLSRVVELEAMRLAAEGKAAGWRTLRTLAESDRRLDSVRLDELNARARQQVELLEQLRVRAAADVFGSD